MSTWLGNRWCILQIICEVASPKLVPELFKKTQTGRRGVVLLNLPKLGARLGWMVRIHAPATLPPGLTRYPLYRWLSGPQERSELVQKIFRLHRDSIPRTVQPVASRYTDWAIPVHGCKIKFSHNIRDGHYWRRWYQDFMLNGKDFLRWKLLTDEEMFHRMVVFIGAILCKMTNRGASRTFHEGFPTCSEPFALLKIKDTESEKYV
jgi:hypothetical protein